MTVCNLDRDSRCEVACAFFNADTEKCWVGPYAATYNFLNKILLNYARSLQLVYEKNLIEIKLEFNLTEKSYLKSIFLSPFLRWCSYSVCHSILYRLLYQKVILGFISNNGTQIEEEKITHCKGAIVYEGQIHKTADFSSSHWSGLCRLVCTEGSWFI